MRDFQVIENDSASPPVRVNSVMTVSGESTHSSESVRALRTHIMARHVSAGHRALAICSTTRGSGCTFVATNLAVALSQIGINTLLIDADLRKPGVARALGRQPVKADLQAALSTPANFSDCIERNVLPNLSVMFSAGGARNAQELLANLRFERLMDFCLREFESTIVDTPPANIYSDARRISTVVGYSLIVARRNRTHLDDVKTLVEQLHGDHATVIGTVLNDA
ncbi:MAG TPA: CpsD/CapB family tyrosine-protein kinase [Aggregatilineales bacterium]|nr:CpsD/CapB family tyrosine-protein kinase [Aggregatilineales bacterium]